MTLLLTILGGFLLLFYFYNPSKSSFFLPCPFKLASGYNCPGCGSQRAIHQLVHGNIGSAFELNPLMVLSIPLIFYGLGTKVHNYLFNSTVRFNLFYSKLFIYGYFSLAVVYWVVRNMSIYPFTR